VVQPRREPRLVEEHRDLDVVVRVTQSLHDGELAEAHGAPRHGEKDLGHASAPQARDGHVLAQALRKGGVPPFPGGRLEWHGLGIVVAYERASERAVSRGLSLWLVLLPLASCPPAAARDAASTRTGISARLR